MKYSILITSYECYGKGADLLKESLLNVFSQTYRPIQCIVSDHSKDDVIKEMISTLDTNGVEFLYLKYSEHYGNPCHNWNNALKYCTGDYIHYLAMDDRLACPNVVQETVSFMETSNAKWIACSHIIDPTGYRFTPTWNNNILHGNNTISGPSAVVLDKSLKHINLDPTFIWFLDLDWYYRLYKEAGKPTIYDNVLFINRFHSLQLTNIVCNRERQEHEAYLLRVKYGNPLPYSS
jgi:glycosyltransferase involved in cell wall biosynthesis